ncbi:hypothetical protein C7405_110198 [Paraburkholderia caballeronis]|uniref:hypothetical protein n=1 Tax=Paraburkholderia caballeronis TaxID=416943 RepID=UPI001066FF2F|nr:hypothetical protein [Paraburkholderia caballeronis]TDV33947.1 hypothetical protein C7405_110198 [Paraburkholderia caballeronis]
MFDTDECVGDDESGRLSNEEADAERWVAALTLTGLLMTMMLVAGLSARSAVHDVDPACFRNAMNGERALMEASFQSAPEQDAVMQARRACSTGRAANSSGVR